VRLRPAFRAETNAVSDMAKRPLRRIKRKTIALWNATVVISGPFLLASCRVTDSFASRATGRSDPNPPFSYAVETL
jgi:hypothetical protein